MEPTTPAPTPPTPAPDPAPVAPSTFVSPEYSGPSSSPFSKQNAFRIFVAVLAVVIVGELAWAGYTLTRPVTAPEDTNSQIIITSPSPVPAAGSIKLIGATESTVGGTLKVDVIVSSNEETDGTDAIIKYDPKVLTATAVNTGTIYADYPMKSIDAAAGIVTISGLTAPGSTGFTGQGSLAEITFKVLRAGQTNLTIDYVADSTVDSNILGTIAAKDILIEVQDLMVTIK